MMNRCAVPRKWVPRERQRWDDPINGRRHDLANLPESTFTVHCPQKISVVFYKTTTGCQGELSQSTAGPYLRLTPSSKESTTKAVSSLLDSQPRWLRPKDREEMEQRIASLSESRSNARAKRDGLPPAENEQGLASVLDLETLMDFSETPLDDLLVFTPEVPLSSNFSSSKRNSLSSHFHGRPSSCLSTTSLRGRLSQYSGPYLKNIARLLESLSVADDSSESSTMRMEENLSTAPTVSGDEASVGSDTICDSVVEDKISPAAVLNLDLFLEAQGICLPGFKAHDTMSCWCAVRELLSSRQLFRVNGTPENLLRLDMKFKDAFGNTVLHLLAARGATTALMTEAMKRGVDPNAQNTAGETFLHVLHPVTFYHLAEDWGGIEWNTFVTWLRSLNSIRHRHRIQFNLCDHLGRSFYHIFSRHAKNCNRSILSLPSFSERISCSKDVFGWEPHPWLRPEFPARNRWAYDIKDFASGQEVIFRGLPYYPLPQGGNNEIKSSNCLMTKHARLLETARLALQTPRIRDVEGRNGLHCLAETSLASSLSDSLFSPGARKRHQRLKTRLEIIQQLVAVGVEVNDYDGQGSTVLMAFIKHLDDGEDDKMLAMILEQLIRSGANVHWRNRKGETALHVAVRLGRKIATRVLLDNGANVHARNSEEEGVLALGERHYLKARDNPQLYASIMACMALTIRYGAVAKPTFVQEWLERDS